MAKNKLFKYADILTLPTVIISEFESTDPVKLKKQWDNNFPVKQEITLELGCGKGEYTIGLAEKFPDKNHIGVDIKGARLWHGATKAVENKISNALFLRIQIEHLINYFPEKSISEIWITFPDPHHKQPSINSKKRLTSEKFLSMYKKLLKQNGFLHLKTDNEMLYKYSLGSIKENNGKIISHTEDLYNSEFCTEIESIKTNFEKKYLSEGKPIKYIKFTL